MKESLLAPAEPGSYILLLFSPKRSALTVGRLGDLTVEPGWYLYVGSALGAGGLRGRLRHHLRPPRRPHWHIDYLRQACDLWAIWFVASAERWEHRWAQTLSAMETAMPLLGFGASDCRCVSHCFFLTEQPTLAQLQQQLLHSHPGLPFLHELAPSRD